MFFVMASRREAELKTTARLSMSREVSRKLESVSVKYDDTYITQSRAKDKLTNQRTN